MHCVPIYAAVTIGTKPHSNAVYCYTAQRLQQVKRSCNEVPSVRLPPVAEEGQKLPKDKDWWRDEDLGRVDESTEGFPLPPKYVLVLL
jgi:hypothetical protein